MLPPPGTKWGYGWWAPIWAGCAWACEGRGEACSSGDGRDDEEATSDGACEVAPDTAGALLGFWNSFLTSNFGWVVADVGGWLDGPADLPFGEDVDVAGTDPNEDTVADFMAGTDAGEEEIGAEASLIEPNVTAFAAGRHPISTAARDNE